VREGGGESVAARSAHTYASENADRYIALEDASEGIARRIRALVVAPTPPHEPLR
jgi:hypothetical protein